MAACKICPAFRCGCYVAHASQFKYMNLSPAPFVPCSSKFLPTSGFTFTAEHAVFLVSILLHSHSMYSGESLLNTPHTARLMLYDAAFIGKIYILCMGVTGKQSTGQQNTHGCNTFCNCICVCYRHCLSGLFCLVTSCSLMRGFLILGAPITETSVFPSHKLNSRAGLTCLWAVFA